MQCSCNNVPAVQLGVGEQDRRSRVWSQGCPEGPRLGLMCHFPGGCRGAWRSGETLPLQRRGQETPGKGESYLAFQIAMKTSRLALLGDGPGQSITSAMSWETSALQCQGSEQLRGFWPCEVMTLNYMQLNSVKEQLGKFERGEGGVGW